MKTNNGVFVVFKTKHKLKCQFIEKPANEIQSLLDQAAELGAARDVAARGVRSIGRTLIHNILA